LIPKGRKQALYGKMRTVLSPVWRAVAGQRGRPLLEGPRGQAPGHMRIRIAPQDAVAEVLGSRKGKRAIAVARQCGGRQSNVHGERFWARGDAVSTVGFAEAPMRASLQPQEQLDAQGEDEPGACSPRDR